MVHSTTTDWAFRDGVALCDQITRKEKSEMLVGWIFNKLSLDDHLSAMAFYDGYIRRKYGLVDENGEEIFR